MDNGSLEAAHAEVRKRLRSVEEGRWDAPTPCEGWSVRNLVSHMAVGATMSCRVLAGEDWSPEEVAREVSSAGDPAAEWERRTADERAGFSVAGALERSVKHPVMGEIPAAQFLSMRVSDALLHAWDLARATGADEQLPAGLVAEVWEAMSPMAALIGGSGFFGSGPSGDLGEETPLQLRLLDLSGRRP